MKVNFLLAIVCIITAFIACDNDDPVSYDYHAHIMQPSSADKHMGDILFIQVEFESHTGEAVEHANVRIYNKTTQTVIYSEPDDPHVGGGSDYEFHDQIELSAANGFSAGDWVIEATVWGEDEGQDLVRETIEFTILP